jgi:hypothetical protein
MQLQVIDLVKACLRQVGALRMGMPLDAEEANNALQALNMWIDSLASDNLMTLANLKAAFTLTAGVWVYTIGTGGAFNAVKPTRIVDAFTRDTYGVDRPIEIRDMQWYDSQDDKTFVSAPVTDLAYDPGPTQQVVPVGIIYLYPIPDNSSTYTLYLGTDTPFTEFTYLTDIVTFPASYLRMIKYNFAVDMWGEYHHSNKDVVPQWLENMAAVTKREVESMNASTRMIQSNLDVPGVHTGMYNIFSDQDD